MSTALRRSVASAVLLLALALPLHAGSVTQSVTVNGVPVGGTASATVPQFDPAVGILRSVTVRIQVSTSGTIQIENTNPSPVLIWSFSPGWILGTTCALFPFPPSTSGVSGTAIYYPPTVSLAAYDGVVDYAGPSGTTITFNGEGSGSTSSSGTQTFSQDFLLELYHGTGSASILVGGVASGGPTGPAGVVVVTTAVANASMQFTYDYDSMPAPICRASANSQCPCGNSSPVLAGCGNSVNGNGGALASSGSARITADTLVLTGSGMTNSSALFAQGTSFSFAQTQFGDGLRCIGGTIRRLGTKANSAGVSQYPAPGDAPISVRGLVTAPGTRYYQVYYRDLGSFCTPAAFNMTSGVAIRWTI
jgi:hypothetical protein